MGMGMGMAWACASPHAALAPLTGQGLRDLRRQGQLGEFVSVYPQHDSVQLASDGGRVCRQGPKGVFFRKGFPLKIKESIKSNK
jgi:hypothetical protein